MQATFTCQVLPTYQAGLNVTKLVSSWNIPSSTHDSRQPGAVDAGREFPLPLPVASYKKHVLILPPLPLDVTSTATSTCDTYLEQVRLHCPAPDVE